jgi:hypothetical protein
MGPGFTDKVARKAALLQKSSDVRGSPVRGQSHPTAWVSGMPSAVKPFRNARANATGS